MSSSELSPCQRDMAEARKRIKYKYARYHMDDEPADEEDLRERVNEVIYDEMSDDERELLKQDLVGEMNRIRDYWKRMEEYDADESEP